MNLSLEWLFWYSKIENFRNLTLMKSDVNLYTFSGLYFYSEAVFNQSFTCWEEVKLIEHSSIVDVKAETSNQV